MKNKNKIKFWLFLSIGSFFLMAVSFLIMPFGNNVLEKQSPVSIIAGLMFWIFLIFGIVAQIITAKLFKENLKSYQIKMLKNNKKRVGIISFFENIPAMVADILCVLSLIVLIVLLALGSTSYICYVLIFVFVFALCMHCVLNGKIYNTLFTKNYKEKMNDE